MAATYPIWGPPALVLVAFVGVGCGGPHSPNPDTAASVPFPTGSWRLQTFVVEHGCPELGPIDPLPRGRVRLAAGHSRAQIRGEGTTITLRRDGRRWRRKTALQHEGTRGVATAEWALIKLGAARFRARVRARIVVDDAQQCQVTHLVEGVRR